MSEPSPTPDRIAVDGHVHIHPGFHLREVLDSAAGSFCRARKRAGLTGTTTGCLWLVEVAGVDRFAELRRLADNGGSVGPWSVGGTARGEAVTAVSRGGSLVIIAGRQLQTLEGLEVSAIGCARELPENLRLAAAVDRVLEEALACVVPWGFGKWARERGHRVRELLESSHANRIFLGDNGGRCRGTRDPSLFALARARGVPILPGSDPFPFAFHVRRIGGYGFWMEGPLDSSDPAGVLVERIKASRMQPMFFGSLTSPAWFLYNQAAMQLRKRLPRRTTAS